MTVINGTFYSQSTSQTTHTVTVPTGVTAGMQCLWALGTGDSVTVTFTPTTSGSGTFTALDAGTTATNTRAGLYSGTGFVAGDTVTFTLNIAKQVAVGHQYRDDVTAWGTVSAGTRPSSQLSTTTGSVTPTSGQLVLAVFLDRTSTAPTLNSVTSSGGETVTQRDFQHSASATAPVVGVAFTEFTASAAAARTSTANYSGGSTNGIGWAILTTTSGPPSYSTDVVEPFFSPQSWFDPMLTPGGWFESSWAPPLTPPSGSPQIDGAYYSSSDPSSSPNTVHTVTVPIGVTAAHRLLLMLGTGDSVSVTKTATTSGSGKFSVLHDGMANNTSVGIWTGKGFVAGDTITITLSASKDADIGHWYETDVVYGYVTEDVRTTTTAVTTTRPARPLPGQRVVVLGLDRDSGLPTVSSVTSSGGETVTQRDFQRGGTAHLGMYIGEFTASAQDKRSATITMTTAAGNGLAALVPVFDSTHTAVDQWMARPLRYGAHRGGSDNWVEMTEYAYNQATAWNPTIALEISVWKTSDGVWVASHDQTTGRIFGTNTDIPSNTWATISGYTTTTGGYPIAKMTDIFDQHQGRVFIVDNKQNTNVTTFLDLLDSYGGKDFFVSKGFNTATGTANAALARGYTTWGYYYDADIASNLPANNTSWSILAMDVAGTGPNWATILGYGKPTDAHIIDSKATATTAFAKGLDGLMVSDLIDVVPTNDAFSTSFVAPAGGLSFSGAVSRGNQFVRALTAALSFTGTNTKRTSRALAANLNLFSGPAARSGGSATGTSTSPSFTVPANARIGDVVVFTVHWGGGATSITDPSNATLQASIASTGYLYTAVVNGTTVTAGGAITATLGVGRDWLVNYQVYEGIDATTPVIAATSTNGTGNVVSPFSFTNPPGFVVVAATQFSTGGVTLGAYTPPANYFIRQQVASAAATGSPGAFISEFTVNPQIAQWTSGQTWTPTNTGGAYSAFNLVLRPSTSVGITRVIGKSLAGALSFVGSFFRLTSKALSGALSYVGGLVPSFIGGGPILKALSASLGFTGSQTKQTGKTTTGVLTFTGAQVKASSRALAAALGFTGSDAFRTSRGLGASLGFSGSIAKRTSRSLTGGLSFTGSLSRALALVRSLTASLAFTGSQSKRTSRALAGGLSFTGAVAQSKTFLRALAASLGFAGSTSRSTSRPVAGGLSFTGTATKASTRALAASLGFTGSVTRRTARALSGGLSFTGSVTKRGAKNLTAGLSFVGSQAKQTSRLLAGALSFSGNLARVLNGGGTAYTANLSASLSFTGSQTKAMNRLISGVLSFTGAVSRRTSRTTTGVLTFSGSATRRTGKALSGGLSFIGSQARSSALVRALTASLAFTGSVAKRTSRGLGGSLSFTGAVTTSKVFLRALSASLGFVGSQSKQTGKAQAANLTFTGSQTKRTTRGLAGTLTFTGTAAKSVRRAISATLSYVGALAPSRTYLRSLTASLSFSGAVKKRTSRNLSGTLTPSGTITRRVGKALAGALTFTGNVGKGIRKRLAAALSAVGALVTSKFQTRSPVVKPNLTLDTLSGTIALTNQASTVSVDITETSVALDGDGATVEIGNGLAVADVLLDT